MPIEDTQSTHKQHAVPQNIMDVEFKIIGDLTMRQFFYLLIFGALAYGAYVSIDNILKWFVIIALVLIGVGLAFVPIEERGMDEWIVNFFRAAFSSNQSVWRKSPEELVAFSYTGMNMVRHELITLTPTSSRRKLEEYLETQTDTQEADPLDISNSTYVKMVRDAFYVSPVTTTTTTTVAPTTRTTVLPATPQQPAWQPTATPASEEPTEQPNQLEQQYPEFAAGQPNQALDQVPELQVQQAQQPAIQVQQPQNMPQPTFTPQQTPAVPTAVLPLVPPEPNLVLPPMDYEPLEPITPDRLSGRQFTSLLPKSGQIVLPVRGRVLESTEEQEIEEDINEKAAQLKALLDKIKTDEGLKLSPAPAQPSTQGVYSTQAPTTQAPTEKPISGQQPTPAWPEPTDIQTQAQPQIKVDEIQHIERKLRDEPDIIKEFTQRDVNELNEQLEKLRSENSKLTREIEKMKQEIRTAQRSGERSEKLAALQKLETERTETEKSYSTIKDTVESLRNILPGAAQKEQNEPITTPPPIQVSQDKINIVTGSVTDDTGKSVEGVVLIIKNESGEPVRALKTDALGKFAISTPLSNGSYTLETDKAKKTTLTFDIIKVDANGTEIPSIQIVGRKAM